MYGAGKERTFERKKKGKEGRLCSHHDTHFPCLVLSCLILLIVLEGAQVGTVNGWASTVGCGLVWVYLETLCFDTGGGGRMCVGR